MRLIRIVADVIDDGAELGIIKNDFSSEILVEPNSSLSLLNCSMNVANSSLTVDGANNDIEFQFTAATGVRTASLTSGTFIANAHDAFFRTNLIRNLNNSLGRVSDHANTPVGGDDSTGGGYSEDIGKMWAYVSAGGVYSARWQNGTRSTTKADWNIDTTLTATPAATTTYNASTFTNTSAKLGSSFWSVTPYSGGCGQFYMRIKAWQATTDEGEGFQDPTSGALIGLMTSDPKLPGQITMSQMEHGVSIQQSSVDFLPKAYLIKEGAIPVDEGGFPTFGPKPVYFISAGNNNNATIAINRNFGHLQYLQYADVYFKYLHDGGAVKWDSAMDGFKFETTTTLLLGEDGSTYDILNDDGSTQLYTATIAWDTADPTSATYKEAAVSVTTKADGEPYGSGQLQYLDTGGSVFRWRLVLQQDGAGVATWNSPETIFDTATQLTRTNGNWVADGFSNNTTKYGTNAPWSSPNEQDFPLSFGEAVSVFTTIQALSPNPYSTDYPGTATGDYPAQINNTALGTTIEVKMFNDVDVKSVATLYPAITLISPDTTPAAPSADGYVSIDNVRGTLDAFIAPTKHFSIHGDHTTLGAIGPPSVPTNRTTTKNFLKLSTQVGDYIGFYNRSQRSGSIRTPQEGFNIFRPNQSIKTTDPNAGKGAVWQYTGTRAVISSELFQNYQLLWNSKPLAGFDGATSAPKSLLATIPVQITTNGGFQYEARNVNKISFRNAESFSLRNAEIQILSADGNPVAFNGLQTFTLSISP